MTVLRFYLTFVLVLTMCTIVLFKERLENTEALSIRWVSLVLICNKYVIDNLIGRYLRRRSDPFECWIFYTFMGSVVNFRLFDPLF